jgi:hypothetical protein
VSHEVQDRVNYDITAVAWCVLDVWPSRHDYPEAATIHLVMDNLNTHCEKSLTAGFGPEQGLWSRFKLNYTPTRANPHPCPATDPKVSSFQPNMAKILDA